MEWGIRSRGTNPSRDENPERYVPGKLNFAPAICYSKNATEGFLRLQQIYKITRKDIKIFAKKWKRTGDFDTNNKNIQSGYRIGIWQLKMCHGHNEKREKRNSGRKKSDNQEKIRTLREKEITNTWNTGSGHHQTSGNMGPNTDAWYPLWVNSRKD